MMEQRPDGFPTCDRPSGWRDVRLRPERADAWLEGIADLWTRAETRPVMAGLWAPFFEVIAPLRATIEATLWRHVDGANLVQELESSVSIRLGIDGFLPPAYATHFDWGTRRVLYFHALLLEALALLEEDPRETFATPAVLRSLPYELRNLSPRARVLIPMVRAEYFLLLGPHLEREIARRARDRVGGQIGVNVALLMLSSAAQDLLGGGLPDQKEALDRLVRSLVARNRTLLKVIDPKPGSEGGSGKGDDGAGVGEHPGVLAAPRRS